MTGWRSYKGCVCMGYASLLIGAASVRDEASMSQTLLLALATGLEMGQMMSTA